MTSEILQKATSLNSDKAKYYSDLINTICPKYGIVDGEIMRCFLATILHESGEFRIKTESLYYTTPSRIVAIWPSRFNLTGNGGKRNANDYIRNEQKLANVVYNGRMGNRNGTNDGFAFRGAGFIQLTGRESFEAYANYKQNKNIEQIATFIRTQDEYALDSACWEFAVDKKLLPIAAKGDFKMVTLKINGGYIGMTDRQKYYDKLD